MDGTFPITIVFDAYSGDLTEGVSIDILKSESEHGIFFPVANVSMDSVSFVDYFGTTSSHYCVADVISGVSYGSRRDYQRGYADALTLMIDEIRRLTNDTKYTWMFVTKEELGDATGDNGQEIFETDNLPMAGYGYTFRIDRWIYEPIVGSGWVNSNRRQVIPDVKTGRFIVPHVKDSGKAYADYIYALPRAYKFSDHELRLYIKDAIAEVNNLLYNSNIAMTGYGPSLEFSSSISAIQTRLLVLMASLYVQKALQETMSMSAIYVKEGQTVVDLSRGLSSRKDSIRDFEKRIDALVENQQFIAQTEELESGRIDTYSTGTGGYGLISIGQFYEINKYEEGFLVPGQGGQSGGITHY